MSEQSNDDKSEKASAQKLRKGREKGQVARSRDWATAVGIFVCLQLIVMLTPGYLEDLRLLFARSFAPLLGAPGDLETANSALFATTMMLIVKMVLPLFAVPVIVGIASMYPGGWIMSAAPLAPKLERVSPMSYFKRIFKMKHVVETVTAALKAAALLAVLYYMARGSVDDYLRLQSLPLDQALYAAAQLMLDGVMALCAVFIGFALIDLPVQSFVFLRDQRMSKREVKEEHKSNEGRPEVRQRIRQLQTQMARRGMRKTIPTADVVIVNPEHYAVALKYDEKRAAAPFVIAKGIDEMALYIRQIATGHGVEIVPLPPLARAIYNTSQVNQQIPAALYQAVARVLGYVLQIKAFRNGRRRSQPDLPSDLAVPDHLT
ncbi:MAG TPA: flagellar type III secretion system protein FlhB [Povalibacter sp.]|uniref:flagellar type III secretion system protein FlhB n=1 Tax=Povalibacter sp. TaxID=1962978 RepID=UPI002C770D57|nr:flagellar type III secretion system protein FlhB [Povalibacter sp.]HMN43163.1 flagellar type III secretion system protein FlhB [Povalibacter sp.]